MAEAADDLRSADMARRRAMIQGDVEMLNRLLADDLTWTHSSGITEGKAEFVRAIASGNVVYETLGVDNDEVRREGSLLVHRGTLEGRASRDGVSKVLHARLLLCGVWAMKTCS